MTPHLVARAATWKRLVFLALCGRTAWGLRAEHYAFQRAVKTRRRPATATNWTLEGRARTSLQSSPRAFRRSSALRSADGDDNASPRRSVALITGTTDGIGVTTAKNVASQGVFDTLVLHGREARRIENSRAVVQKFVAAAPGATATHLPSVLADLSTLQGCYDYVAQVRQLLDADESLSLDLVLHNAGVYSNRHVLTSDGLELTFAVNVLAPFVITSLLLPHLRAPSSSAKSKRVVLASSVSQSRSIQSWDAVSSRKLSQYSAHQAYGESKLMDAMLTMEFAQRWNSYPITCNCLDPGTVNTKMLLDGWGPIGIHVEDALGETWLCTSDEVEGVSGKYFIGQNDRMASATAYDASEREQLWKILTDLAPEAAGMWKH